MCVIVWSASLMRERSQVASSGICTTGICQTNTDEPISEDRLVALGKRQPVNDTIKITIRMKGGAMPRPECGRRRRPAAEVQA
jgi:hypothetical protein